VIVRRLIVRNYRALREVDVELGGLTYLVGRNGAGKSTILSALGVFFRQVRIHAEDFTLDDASRPMEIEVTFGRLGREAESEFARYVRAGELTVTKRISVADGTLIERYYAKALRFSGFNPIRAESGRARIDAYRAARATWTLPAATSAAAVDEALLRWEEEHPDALELAEDDGSFFGFTNVGVGKISKYVDLVLVPAVRDAAIDAAETRDSTLRRLVDAVIRRSLDIDAELTRYRQEMADGYRAILEQPQLSLESLETRMTASIERFAPGTSVKLRWNEATEPEIPSPAAIARLADDGLEGDIVSKGHGLQRAYVMAALQALAEVEAERETGGEQATPRGLLLAVEEPELYQHPAQARHIARTFAHLTAGTSQVQIIACTHSPIFIDIRSFESLRVVRKRPAALTETARATLEGAAAALGVAHAHVGQYTGEGLRPGLRGLLNPYLSEAFFSDFVVLVEGEEDKAILEPILSGHRDWTHLTSKAVVVTPVGGKKNLDKLVVILAQLGIPHYVVFDADGEQGEDREDIGRTNIALQRLVGVSEPEEHPATGAHESFAVFSPNLSRCLKGEIGETEWLTYRDRACREFGIEVRTHVDKNAEVVGRMLELADADGRSSPGINRCADAIISAALRAYPPAANGT
jgi:putative ATP-dependent endonuclease of the OLD family